jgi:hypothetical protein
VEEFFDIGHTRALPWQRRPQSSRLLAALRDPGRGFYRSLGLRLTYDPQTQTVRAEIDLAAHRWDSACVRGSTRTEPNARRR